MSFLSEQAITYSRLQIRIFSRQVFLFTRGGGTRAHNGPQFQELKFGALRAIRNNDGGRRAEDPFRGLRAGPARSSPRLFSSCRARTFQTH